jgi:hypothetical protein
VAQAVDEVATSSSLPGKKAVYFSSAGNRGRGFASDLRIVSNQEARTVIDPTDFTINLNTIPNSVDTTGGFHDFNPDPNVTDLSQTVTCSGAACTIVFQWDDPYNTGGITSNFNLLVFDANTGNYVANLSLTADNFATDQPVEISSTTLAANTTYRFVIARTGQGANLTTRASRLRYVFFGGSLLGEYNSEVGTFVATYGHNSAENGNGTAAYVYDDVPVAVNGSNPFTPSLEGFSSPGPVTIAFDAAGNRFATPQTRRKPELAAPDGVNTTFFPPGPLTSTDYEGDGFPNFFGTSAAAPHAAAVAALLLDRAGGPLSLTPAAIRSLLQSTAPARDTDPTFSQAVATNLTASGNGDISNDPNFFRVQLGGSGLEIASFTLDATAANLVFDPSITTGFPVTVSATSDVPAGSVTSSLPAGAPPSSTLTLTFAPGSFVSGRTLRFGVDRDVAGINGFGNSADVLAGTTFSATLTNGEILTGTFTNTIGTGYTVFDGFGLIDALSAVNALP